MFEPFSINSGIKIAINALKTEFKVKNDYELNSALYDSLYCFAKISQSLFDIYLNIFYCFVKISSNLSDVCCEYFHNEKFISSTKMFKYLLCHEDKIGNKDIKIVE